MSFTVVDLPEPFGPSRPKTSPRCTSKSTLSTARALGRPQKSLKIFVRPRTRTTTSASECGVRGVECGVRSAECGVESLRVIGVFVRIQRIFPRTRSRQLVDLVDDFSRAHPHQEILLA